MTEIVPTTPELVAAGFRLLAAHAALNTSNRYLAEPPSFLDLDAVVSGALKAPVALAKARAAFVTALVEAMRTTGWHTWLHTYTVDEFGGRSVLIGRSENFSGRRAFVQPEEWAHLQAATDHLTPQDRKIQAAQEEDWSALEELTPLLLGIMTTDEAIAAG